MRPVANHAADGETPVPVHAVPLRRTSVTGRAVLDRKTNHVADIVPILDTEYPDARENAVKSGFRALLAVPLIRDGTAYGAIVLWRREPGLFAPDQVALVETFATQAAIAIENVRLFHATQEALEQQTATSEILRVISSSPTDVQPVFETIAANALRLCDATFSALLRYDGDYIDIGAFQKANPEATAAFRSAYPCRPNRGGGTQRAILTRRVVHIPDIRADPEYSYRNVAKSADYLSVLSVPMLRDGHPIGAISVYRDVARPFPDSQIELLKTFADQAVIAIENVRLFSELQGRNRGPRRGARATDGDRRNITCHQQLADRRAAGLRRHRRQRTAPVRRPPKRHISIRWRTRSHRRALQPESRGRRVAAPRLSRGSRPRQSVAPGHSHPGHGPYQRRSFGSGIQAPRRRQGGRLPKRALRAHASRRSGHRHHHRVSRCGKPISGYAGRAVEGVCRPGRDRDRERAAVQGIGSTQHRPDRSTGTADGDERDPARDQPIADRCAAGI